MKNLALAASVMMLVAISGQAFAKTAAQNARDWSETTGASDRQAASTFDAFDSTTANANRRARCVPLSWRTEIQRLTFEVRYMVLANSRGILT
jgi:hypothetical protein